MYSVRVNLTNNVRICKNTHVMYHIMDSPSRFIIENYFYTNAVETKLQTSSSRFFLEFSKHCTIIYLNFYMYISEIKRSRPPTTSVVISILKYLKYAFLIILVYYIRTLRDGYENEN